MKAAITSMVSMVVFAGCSLVGIQNVEQPKYSVIKEDNKFEIRQYTNTLVATTLIDAEYGDGTSVGFRRLAGYIFGDNLKNQEIAMTSPVIQETVNEKIAMTSPVIQEKTGDQWQMSFVLPSEYTLETLPMPLDDTVKIEAVSGKKVASIRYTGFRTEAVFKKRSKQLLAWINDNGYTVMSAPRLASYDPPWTIPFFRRNEVWIDIE